MKELPGISFIEENGVPTIDSDNALYMIPLWKDEEYFSNIDSRTKFIKAVEKLVRSDERYSAYKKHLMEVVDLNHCVVLKNIDNQDVSIEMHHGPIFTLFDYVDIMISYFLLKGWKINTMRIASAVLDEHENDNVQVVMLSSTIHEEVGDRNIFIHPSQAYGHIDRFIKKYLPAIGNDLREKYNRYMDRCMISDGSDYGLLEVNSRLWEDKDTFDDSTVAQITMDV